MCKSFLVETIDGPYSVVPYALQTRQDGPDSVVPYALQTRQNGPGLVVPYALQTRQTKKVKFLPVRLCELVVPLILR